MKPRSIILLFALLGIILEGAAFFIGIAFTGVRDFGPYWPLAAIYYLGLWPDWLLPDILGSSPWSAAYLVLPILFWTLVGILLAVWGKRWRHSRLNKTSALQARR